MEDIELTEDELSRVNNIITAIQFDLDTAISHLKNHNYEAAIVAINSSITKSNCPLCKRELGTLKADIVHNKEICILKSDTCTQEHDIIIKKAYELKDDFVPIKTKKKAIKEKFKHELKNKQRLLLNLPPLPPLFSLFKKSETIETKQFDARGKSPQEIDEAVKRAEKARWRIRIKVPSKGVKHD